MALQTAMTMTPTSAKIAAPHVCDPECGQEQAQELDANGEINVFVDDPQALAGDTDCFGDASGIVVH